MSQKDQDKGKGSIDRRDFIKQTGLTIFGGIAFSALSGISPAFDLGGYPSASNFS